MLEAVLRELNNWFEVGCASGAFEVSGGTISVPEGFLQDGQHFRIVGSTFNDGLHTWPCDDLADEEFEGHVHALAVPAAVVDLAAEAASWEEENGAASRSPYASESFDGYSYSRNSSSGGAGGGSTWQSAFRGELRGWRKL